MRWLCLKEQRCDSVASVVALPPHMCPDYVMRIDEQGRLVNFLPEGARLTRRQDVRPAYVRDGTVYAFRVATLREYRTYTDLSVCPCHRQRALQSISTASSIGAKLNAGLAAHETADILGEASHGTQG